jgi:hypothetical protein
MSDFCRYYDDLNLWQQAFEMAKSVMDLPLGEHDPFAIAPSAARIPTLIAIGYSSPDAEIFEKLSTALEEVILLEHKLALLFTIEKSSQSKKTVALHIDQLKAVLIELIEGDDEDLT